MLNGLAEQEVAHEDGCLVVQKAVHALLATTAVALVNNIVVHQGCRVQKFHGNGRMDNLIADHVHTVVGTTGSQHHQYGTHLLAGAASQVIQCHSKQRIVGLERLTEHFIETCQVGLNGFSYLF